jgi:hypothetical protein
LELVRGLPHVSEEQRNKCCCKHAWAKECRPKEPNSAKRAKRKSTSSIELQKTKKNANLTEAACKKIEIKLHWHHHRNQHRKFKMIFSHPGYGIKSVPKNPCAPRKKQSNAHTRASVPNVMSFVTFIGFAGMCLVSQNESIAKMVVKPGNAKKNKKNLKFKIRVCDVICSPRDRCTNTDTFPLKAKVQ